MEDRELLVNRIKTPDGTILCSRHRHDYVTHVDANGKEYSVDGGHVYRLRTEHPDAPYTEMSLYVGDDFELIREAFARGTYGKKRNRPFRYVLLKDMSDKWLLNTIRFILTGVYNADFLRIEHWLMLNDQWFKTLRPIMVPLIKHHMKENGITSTFLSEVYLKEMEYRLEHSIYIPDVEDEEVKPSLWRKFLKFIGL